MKTVSIIKIFVAEEDVLHEGEKKERDSAVRQRAPFCAPWF